MSANTPKIVKLLEFQLKASNASKKAQSALDYAILSGKPSKVSDLEVLAKLTEMLSSGKFDDYEIVFFRNDPRTSGEPDRTEYSLERMKSFLENDIEVRPQKMSKDS